MIVIQYVRLPLVRLKFRKFKNLHIRYWISFDETIWLAEFQSVSLPKRNSIKFLCINFLFNAFVVRVPIPVYFNFVIMYFYNSLSAHAPMMAWVILPWGIVFRIDGSFYWLVFRFFYYLKIIINNYPSMAYFFWEIWHSSTFVVKAIIRIAYDQNRNLLNSQ